VVAVVEALQLRVVGKLALLVEFLVAVVAVVVLRRV
jgi:hypothetical protein